MDYESTIRRINEIDEQLTQLPPGNVVYKTIRGKKQPYLQWSENGKPKSQYIKTANREETIAKAALRKKLTAERKELKAAIPENAVTLSRAAYHTNVIFGEKLYAQADQVSVFEKRDCVPYELAEALIERFLCLCRSIVLPVVVNSRPPGSRLHQRQAMISG